MRIAVTILSLALTFGLLLTSCTEAVGSVGSGGVGIMITFAYLLGGAFALGRPLISLIIFGIAAFLCLGLAVSTTASSPIWWWWFGVTVVLGVLTQIGRRELPR